MIMDITAVFDDADSAEIALVNLQALGIFPKAYKMRVLRDRADGGYARGPEYAGYGAYTSGAPAAQNTGGYNFILSDTPGAAFMGAEPPNHEVMLTLTVEDAAVPRVKSALISNHARRVREM